MWPGLTSSSASGTCLHEWIMKNTQMIESFPPATTAPGWPIDQGSVFIFFLLIAMTLKHERYGERHKSTGQSHTLKILKHKTTLENIPTLPIVISIRKKRKTTKMWIYFLQLHSFSKSGCELFYNWKEKKNHICIAYSSIQGQSEWASFLRLLYAGFRENMKLRVIS